MDYTKESPVILSLCTGMRGLERGLERAFESIGWQQPDVTTYVEIETFIIANLISAMEQGVLAPAPIWSDIKTFPSEQFYTKVHGIIGGYPCQPFSLAGQRGGADDPRHLWPFISGIIKTTEPVWCFFENVSGHLTLGYGEVYRSLRDMGYRVEAGIFTAEEAGAPHQRERLFILAIRGTDVVDSSSGWAGRLRDAACARKGHGTTGGSGISREEKLVNTCIIGRETGISGPNPRHEGVTGKPNYSGDKWPSRPGEEQFSWEEPRVESRLGFTVNGYNFREDLLRMAGNGVVEQTAEIAFLSLLEKFTQ